jgi:hypothetical protein
MSLLGNIVFFIFGGFLIFLGYVLGGILLCLTINGALSGLEKWGRIQLLPRLDQPALFQREKYSDPDLVDCRH